MLRKLGNFEKLVYLNNEVSSSNFAVVAHIDGCITYDVLRTALNMIQPYYPSLNMIVKKEENDLIFWRTSAFIPMRMVDRESDNQWINEINTEINKPFEINLLPLLRVVFLSSANKQEIVVVFHHVIADGISGVHFLHRLIMMIDQLLKNNKAIEINYLQPIPSIEDILNLKNDFLRENKTSLIFLEKANRTTAIFSFQFSADKTQKLMDIAKQYHIKVHSFICAAFCCVWFEKFKLSRIMSHNPVNMRSYFDRKINAEEMGYLLSRIDFAVENDLQDNSFFEVARNIQRKINETLDLNVHVELINDISYLMNHTNGFKRSSFPSVFLSNIGKINLQSQFENLIIKNMSFSVACQGFVDHPDSMAATVSTINNCMTINFHYIEQFIDKKTAQLFYNKIIEKIESIIL